MFKESEAQKAAKDEAWKAQLEIQERRRNPEKMAEYDKAVNERRAAAMAKDAELKQLQRGNVEGDSLEAWKQMKEEGLVTAMDDMERDKGSERMGSEGLVAERIDEKLPYIDSGYVDESQPDVMGSLGKLFGGKKE